MNKIFTVLLASLFAITTMAQTNVEVITGASYVDDVYYSFNNGTVVTTPRNNWDIAFAPDNFNVSILANNGYGVEVYTYPNGAIADWASLDTTGLSTWAPMYNSTEDLYDGAFLRNMDYENAFDQGWGVYNMATHIIEGDSLFVIKTVGGDYKKLAIVEANPNSTANTWSFKFANLDGSDEQVVDFGADQYKDMNYVHYSMDNNEFLNREPNSTDWQLLFTKYFDYSIPYYVSGVQINSEYVTVQQIDEVNQVDFEDYVETDFNSNLSEIGSDWKEFDMASFTYTVEEQRVYFTKVMNETATDSTYWKLYFTAFGGSSDGVYSFTQKNITDGTFLNELEGVALFQLYPNPANTILHLVTDLQTTMDVAIYDISGKLVYNQEIKHGFNQEEINISELKSGVYNLSISTDKGMTSQKFIKQ
ncbi:MULTISPECIES: T9SS type A sorting domain-containing protein [unclassified Lentimicrobium]|uniref:T9SS type A sorting domain-containing protein n=1 Tax=unclassified Lentimicrobium TaxID=2677434 RepID=UPI001551776E|nr:MULTISPECIES: T9SS type A sorting domain-containing protein [unclassified Lentimicrobium]NPD47895.1 T9SS type A sorting domain-containing protein [Lentimicrobium sp. S6]NPD86528.1 T9SS type A sorting domain-containing protein [Lentimicrobium sp. L6]